MVYLSINSLEIQGKRKGKKEKRKKEEGRGKKAIQKKNEK
jgi:hypothetical protein